MFHKNIELRVRRQFSEYVKNLEIGETIDVETPTQEIVPVEGLKVHNGFICTVEGCRCLRTTLTSMKQHCQAKHCWTEQKGDFT